MSRKGRKASVRYHASKGGYFTHFEGKQIRRADGPDDAPKGATYLAALARFQELMQVSHADTADQGNTVQVVVDLYGQHLERNGQAGSLKILLQTCTSAVEQFGDNHGFADNLRFLHGTGCWPGEAYNVEARYYHPGDKCVVYPGLPRRFTAGCGLDRGSPASGSIRRPRTQVECSQQWGEAGRSWGNSHSGRGVLRA